ncbi:DUF7475 family protein [Natrinema gelatinilyticum]|uniref:DUF7475 family protein n=1 Tax=Natrinema gelatinilyticum TaxID=2961571 RepID=UPI0020C51912|nr:hypothetical protein [Natrinema gelatinilyticum]
MSTDTRAAFPQNEGLESLDYAAIVLATISGLIHFYEGYEDLGEGILPILFILAGVGFFMWIGLLLVNVPKKPIYIAGFVFTAIQFVMYFVLNWPQIYEAIGVIDKAVQLVLMIVLVVLYRRNSR